MVKISDEEIREMVIARLETTPSKRKIIIGGAGAFTKRELIEKIKQHDPIGQKIIKVHLNYLRSFKKQQFWG